MSGELPDCAERSAGHVVIGADAIYLTGEHQLLIVRGIASQKVRRPMILDDDGEVTGRVTGSPYRDNIARLGESPAGREGPEGFGGEIERDRIKP